MQAETRNIQILGFDASYIRDFTVVKWFPVYSDMTNH